MRGEAALAPAVGEAERGLAGAGEILLPGEGLGEHVQDVVADRALARGLARELADQRRDLAPLVGGERLRPRALGLGRVGARGRRRRRRRLLRLGDGRPRDRRLGDRALGALRPGDGRLDGPGWDGRRLGAGRLGRRRPGDGRLLHEGLPGRERGQQQEGGEHETAQQRRVARRPTREGDPLERGEVREDREDPERGLEQVEERTGDEADQPLRPLHQAHRARDADRLGARLGVAHHHRAHEPRHRDDGAARVGRAREQDDDAEHHDQVGVPVDDGVEEGAERGHLSRDARHRAVEEVAEPRDDQEEPRALEPAGHERARRQHADAEAEDREVIRAEVETDEGAPHRVRVGAGGLAEASEHRQIGCSSASSSAARMRSRASGASIRWPWRSCT